MGPPRRDGSGLSTLLVLLGIAGVLGGTFGAGFLAGRYWSRVSVMTGLVKPQAGGAAEREATGRATERPATGRDMPSLTFYQELTAPLASPPPRPSEPARPADTGARTPAVPAASVSTTPPAATTTVRSTTPPRSFTVQVGAYGTRAQADALARRLAARGLETSVSEATTDRGVRYRVRVGNYPSRDAARDAAARVTADWHLATFVAPR